MLGIFARSRHDALVSRLYGDIVAQARRETLYTDYGVPDTLEGRYDMMVLHAFLALRRLAEGGEEGRRISQELCDRFFMEMDRAFREMGVSDLGVPKRMKTIGEVFAGASNAYAAALAEPTDAALASALARNVYGQVSPPAEADRLAAYVRGCERSLSKAPVPFLLADGLSFTDPGPAGGTSA